MLTSNEKETLNRIICYQLEQESWRSAFHVWDTGHKAIKNSWSSLLLRLFLFLSASSILTHTHFLTFHTLHMGLSVHHISLYSSLHPFYITSSCPHWSKSYPFFRAFFKSPTFLRNSSAQSFSSLLYFLTVGLDQFTNISGHLLTCTLPSTSWRLGISRVKQWF